VSREDGSALSGITNTNRWRGIVAVALVVAAAGLLAKRQSLLVLATVGIVFATYRHATTLPEPDLELDRRLESTTALDGEEVEVHVSVTNVGDDLLTDLRVFDGVPPAIGVVDGSARRGMALRPGGEQTFSYTVEATHGNHSFEPATVVARDPSGEREREIDLPSTEDTVLDCTVGVSKPPVRQQTLDAVGRITANTGGTGIEFHQTRDYRRGDSMSRVDWRRYAATGELTTVEFREERSASVVLLVDARESAFRSPPEGTHAVDASVSAVEELFEALARGRNRVGLATLGADPCWVPPGTGREHHVRLRDRLARDPAFDRSSGEDPPLDEQVRGLRGRLGDATQLIVLSPVGDDDVVSAVRQLEAHGHPVTLVCPDVCASTTAGERLARVERSGRLHELRQVGVPVVEWSLSDPLAIAVEASAEVSA
jgi:uncharacterized protein (DUF58 family)